jgi:hypothetical protein
MDVCQGYGIGLDLALQDDKRKPGQNWRKNIISLPLEVGELMVVTKIDGRALAHIDTECPYIQEHMGVFDAKDDRWCAGPVSRTEHKFVKLKNFKQLVEVCEYCVER